MIADDKYSRHNRENSRPPIQMQLSKKLKAFPEFVIAFLRAILNFEHSEKKDEPHSLSISENIVLETRGFLIVEKALFQNTLGSKRDNEP